MPCPIHFRKWSSFHWEKYSLVVLIIVSIHCYNSKHFVIRSNETSEVVHKIFIIALKEIVWSLSMWKANKPNVETILILMYDIVISRRLASLQ